MENPRVPVSYTHLLGVVGDNLSGSFLPRSDILNVNNVYAVSFKLLKNLSLHALGVCTVVLLCILTSLHQDSLLILGQLAPGLISNNNLYCTQGMSIQNQVRSNLRECVGLIVCDRLLSTVYNAGLQCGIQLVECYYCRVSRCV